ncbi:DUF655 domain-containing protein [Pyrofollis japonicus]|uniref:DUF655 domain-containing protein n=1 Tax=Pyrofollis japonicus TaxID=3060460 RepID=UPI00295A80B3|nr:DUF655 domain-containing protein [Pyrofollis japonicus]BEP18125.1 DUF655 domain-containing protein [Pyrofollis japonicus]
MAQQRQHFQRSRHKRKPHEEYAYVLDYLPMGNPSDKHPKHRTQPVVQLIGEDYFLLLEALPRRGASLEVGERVYVGPIAEKRLKIFRVEAEIEYDDLTSFAKSMLPTIVEEIVRKKEKVFVEFFNIAGPINIRFHSLELLPGVGKKTVEKIIKAREREPFKSYEDIKERVHIDPVKVITERIIEELKGGQKYYLFIRPPRREREDVVPPMFLNYLEVLYERVGKQREDEEL